MSITSFIRPLMTRDRSNGKDQPSGSDHPTKASSQNIQPPKRKPKAEKTPTNSSVQRYDLSRLNSKTVLLCKLVYIFHGIIPEGVLALLGGAGDVGKSMFGLILCVSAATGRTLLSPFVPREAMRVMYFNHEDYVDQTLERLWSIREHFNLSDKDWALVCENLYVSSTRIGALARAKNALLMPEDVFGDLAKEVKQFKPSFIFMDPKARIAYFDENNNNLTTQFTDMLEELVGLSRATIMVAHHLNKSGRNGDDVSDFRGAGALTDNCRTVLNMRPSHNDQIEVSVAKSNYTKKPPHMFFMRDEKNGIIHDIPSKELTTADALDAVIEVISDAVRLHGPIAEAYLRGVNKAKLPELHAQLKAMGRGCLGRASDALDLAVERGILRIVVAAINGKKGRRGKVVEAVDQAPAEMEDDSPAK